MIDLWKEEQEAIADAVEGQGTTDIPETVQKFSDIRGMV